MYWEAWRSECDQTLTPCKERIMNMHVCVRDGDGRAIESAEQCWFSVCYSSDWEHCGWWCCSIYTPHSTSTHLSSFLTYCGWKKCICSAVWVRQFNRTAPSTSYRHRFFECVFFFLQIQLFDMLSLSCKELKILVHAVTLSLLQSKDMRLMDIHQ